MTIAVAWVATRSDGRQDLYLASDSRTRGSQLIDSCPKLLLLPRGDSAIAFAGDVSITYSLSWHIFCAIRAHEPARERNLDVSELTTHLLRVLNDLVGNIKERPTKLEKDDLQIIFAGFSWRARRFRVWTYEIDPATQRFKVRESPGNFSKRLRTVAFIGDWAGKFRRRLMLALNQGETDLPVNSEPLTVLSSVLKEQSKDSTIGGAPQVVRIGPHMNGRELCVLWNGQRHLFGRALFSYENCDFWVVDPDTGKITAPMHWREGLPDSA